MPASKPVCHFMPCLCQLQNPSVILCPVYASLYIGMCPPYVRLWTVCQLSVRARLLGYRQSCPSAGPVVAGECGDSTARGTILAQTAVRVSVSAFGGRTMRGVRTNADEPEPKGRLCVGGRRDRRAMAKMQAVQTEQMASLGKRIDGGTSRQDISTGGAANLWTNGQTGRLSPGQTD